MHVDFQSGVGTCTFVGLNVRVPAKKNIAVAVATKCTHRLTLTDRWAQFPLPTFGYTFIDPIFESGALGVHIFRKTFTAQFCAI